MQVTQKKLKTWQKLRQYGDITALAAKLPRTEGGTGVSTQRVRQILENGHGSAEQIAVVDKFFAARKKTMKSIAK